MLHRCVLLIVLVSATTPISLHGDPDAGDGDARITRLISRLSDESFAVREATTHELEDVGEPALPALRAAANSNDPEIRFRAGSLVRRIMQTACRSKSTGIELVMLKEGEFMMGSPPTEPDRREDELQHKVSLTHPFLIGACETTQEQYEQVMGNQPSWFTSTGKGRDKVAKEPSTKHFPVDSVTWHDAVEFCNRLSQRDGMPPYYQVRDIERIENSIVGANVRVVGGIGYRLPTEAEWEYACRAGTSTPYQFGDDKNRHGGNFQYRASVLYGTGTKITGKGRTTAVGSYSPNLWGLYDMHGNAAEWCWDWYAEGYYSASPATDPDGPAAGHHRVMRGGSWLVNQSSCRAASRFWHAPSEQKYYVGFRVARYPSRYMISEQ